MAGFADDRVRVATSADRGALVFDRILGDDALGRVWLFEVEGAPAGYVVMTLGYSMEYSGRDAFVDDLFVRDPYRRRGLGRRAMDVIVEECRRREVQALHLEVDRKNLAAKELCRQYGFQDKARQLLTAVLGFDQQTERAEE